jgi:hypothetical protein
LFVAPNNSFGGGISSEKTVTSIEDSQIIAPIWTSEPAPIGGGPLAKAAIPAALQNAVIAANENLTLNFFGSLIAIKRPIFAYQPIWPTIIPTQPINAI